VTIGDLLVNSGGCEVATLREHVVAQDGEAAAVLSRGARVAKRQGEPASKEEMDFVPVRLESPAPSEVPSRYRFRHAGGHELVFPELPEVSWLRELSGSVGDR
jgi:hypothetical protein